MESIRNQGGIYSFVVKCDASNNTPDIVNAGNLAVDISAAPTRTAEFIVLNMTANKYTQDVATSEFVG
jgi:phage tail sheath protein FI